MWSSFAVRFVIAAFRGAGAGLLVGLVATHVFDASWNPFAVMSWGIMAGALGLAFAHIAHPEWLKQGAAGTRKPRRDARKS